MIKLGAAVMSGINSFRVGLEVADSVVAEAMRDVKGAFGSECNVVPYEWVVVARGG